MSCPHHNKIGDNYGITCMDCGEALEGYGNWGEGSKECHHKFVRETLESDIDVCVYCERQRKHEEE